MPDILPTISVVIPTLNEEKRIVSLLDALIAQTIPAREIIVVDGDSEDRTREIVTGHTQDNGTITLLQCERGTARQRNYGARQTTGDLIVFMDADTLPSPEFLARIARSYRRWPFAVACPWFVASENNLAIRAVYFGFNILFWLGQSWLRTGSGVCIITPRAIYEKTGGFAEDLHLGEDVHFIRQAARHGWHRHLLVPLHTSGRRFQEKGIWKLIAFYARISPLIILGRWEQLQGIGYEAAPYEKEG